MGTKVSKDSKDVQSPNKIDGNSSKSSSKNSLQNANSDKQPSDPNLKATSKADSSDKQSVSNKIKKKPQAIEDEKISIKTESISVKKLENEEGNRSSNIRGNNPKKQKIITDQFSSKESEVLKIIKKNNKDFEDSSLIDSLLTRHFFMRVLDKQSRAEIIKEMSLCSVNSGDTVIKESGIGNFFYILKEGTVNLYIEGKLIKQIPKGESFGELALLHGAPRSATIVASSDCLFWVLERKNFKKIVDHINTLHFEENKQFVQSISILSNIENDQKTILCSNLIKEIYEEGATIVKEGDQASCLYIVKEGEVNCVFRGKVIVTLKKGDYFGEKAILIDSTRTMDVVAKTKCVCYSISIETLKHMCGEKYRDVLYMNFIKSSFTQSKYLKKFQPKLVESIYECFSVVNYGKREVVVPTGHVLGSKIINKLKQLIAHRGCILFEKELLKNSKEKLDYDLVASPDCLIVEADMNKVTKILGSNFSDILSVSSIIESIQKVHLFKNFTYKKLENLSEKIGVERYEHGQKIITQGEEGNKFYIVKSGKVDIYVNKNYIRTLNENEYFGERALFFKEPRSATALANGDVEIFFLSKENFSIIIENNLKEYLINRLYLQDNTIELKDLNYIKPLGNGNYGQVSLVQSKKTKYFYAIKSMAKKQIDQEQLHTNIDLEKSILLQIDHPFIVKLVKTLKDSKRIYFLMEFIRGKELFDVIREIGILNKYQTQFYGASMMLAVEYLHEKKFIYRDIKPENILVVESGYIKLIDFGTAKQITDRTATIIGTPHYMAPEVILGEGYSFQVDFWSIAICMYEFVCGGVPFGDTAEDPMDVYMAIINQQMSFPNFLKDKEYRQLMTMMLNKNPFNRLFKLNQIKSHIWFKDFNWENLISFNLDPAYKIKLDPEEYVSSTPYTTFINEEKDWQGDKSCKIDQVTQFGYDKWFKDF